MSERTEIVAGVRVGKTAERMALVCALRELIEDGMLRVYLNHEGGYLLEVSPAFKRELESR